MKKELDSDLEESGEIWFAGVDWGSQVHQVRVSDRCGRSLGDRGFAHSGEGLAELAAWILQKTGASPDAVHIAIEVPHGPVVESLMERGFQLYSINPKQLDRFRDRFSPSGSKDDSRDALVLADSLRTDRRSFRALRAVDPLVVELREWSRIAEELGQDQLRLANRIQNQLWRYFPQLLKLSDGTIEPWLLALWQLAPIPAKAARLRESTIARLLKNHRIRRVSAADIIQALRAPAIPMAPGAVESAVAHIKILIGQIEPIRRQIRQANAQLEARLEHFLSKEETAEGQEVEQRDVTILRSLPGVGKIVLATLLAEASDALHRRDYHALRCLSGVAPVTKRSGKSRQVLMRRAVLVRLRNAIYYWSRIAVKLDPRSRARYEALRANGHNYSRVLRGVGDRLLRVACTMLERQTTFDPNTVSRSAVGQAPSASIA